MKEEKESIFPFRRKTSNRLSLHLDKKEKNKDGKLKRASWSSFPLLRFSSSSTSSSTSSSPSAKNKRGFGRKCSSSEEIKRTEDRNSSPKTTFQRGSNASIRSSVSTSSSSSSTSSVRTGGSSSITSILEGSGSDAFSCDSYGGVTSEFQHHPVSRSSSDIIHSRRRDSIRALREDGDDYSDLDEGKRQVSRSPTSPRILYAHRKIPDVQHRSRKQLVQELEAMRTGLPGSLSTGLDAHQELPRELDTKTPTQETEKTKPKQKRSFSFIHNSKFMNRLETRTKREGKASSEEGSPTTISTPVVCNTNTGHSDKKAVTSCLKSLVSDHLDERSDVVFTRQQQEQQQHHNTQSQLPTPGSFPSPPQRSEESPHTSSLSSLSSHHSHHYTATQHPPPAISQQQQQQQQQQHRSVPPKVTDCQNTKQSRRLQENYYCNLPIPSVTISQPPVPSHYFKHTYDEPCSPPQFSLAAFLNHAFNSTEPEETSHMINTELPKQNHKKYQQGSPRYLEAFNPRYLETSFDSPLDFVTERNYANLLPEIRDIHHQVLLKGRDPCIPLSRSEYVDLELRQNFLGVIGDTIEEEEEDCVESECEIGDFLSEVDSTCFERNMEDKLEEVAVGEERRTSIVESLTDEGQPKPLKKTELKLKLIKPQSDMIKRVVHRNRILRHISEEGEALHSGVGEEEEEEVVALRTPTTPRSPAIDIDNVFEQKQREIAEDTDDMSRLRALTARLQLSTRRPSYLDWAELLKERGRRVGEALATHTPMVVETEAQSVKGGPGEEEEEEEVEELSLEKRKHNLQTAVDWVKKELSDMRHQDQQLARQLLQLRVEVQRLRLHNSCLTTSCLLEEVATGAQEAKMMGASDLCDLPSDLRETFSPVLREIGLTRMNITSRRFSLR